MVARVECVLVPHSARLASVKKEWHTRKRRGREVAYIAISRDRSWALLSQKLSLLSEWINSNLTEGEPCSKVSTNGLYENVDCTDGRAGGGTREYGGSRLWTSNACATRLRRYLAAV